MAEEANETSVTRWKSGSPSCTVRTLSRPTPSSSWVTQIMTELFWTHEDPGISGDILKSWLLYSAFHHFLARVDVSFSLLFHYMYVCAFYGPILDGAHIEPQARLSMIRIRQRIWCFCLATVHESDLFGGKA
jgi:hypothetical protein